MTRSSTSRSSMSRSFTSRSSSGLKILLLGAVLVLGLALPTAAELPIHGRVAGADGSALEGVGVALIPIPGEYERVSQRLDQARGETAVDQGVTDAAGAFTLAAPRPGSYRVVAEAAGYLTMEYLLMPLFDAVELPPVELWPAREMQIQLTDATTGEPLAAEVALYPRRPPVDWRTRLRRAATDAEGVVVLPRHPDEEGLVLEVHAPGRPLLWSRLDAADLAQDSHLLTVPKGTIGTVKVLDPRGRPAPGVVVYQGGGILPLGRTGDDGRVRFALAPEDEDAPSVSFVAPDNAYAYVDIVFESEEEILTLREPWRITGRVLDAVSRLPLAGALVWAPRGDPAFAGRGGEYEILVPGGPRRLEVQATADGYGVGIASSSAEKSAELSFALPPAAAVHGRVLDGDGRPVPGVEIVVAASPTPSHWQRMAVDRGKSVSPWRGRSGEDGRFSFTRLDRDASFELRFNKTGFAPARREVARAPENAPRPELEVRLTRGVAGVGRVVDEQGAPIAGATVSLEPAAPEPMAIMWARSESLSAVSDAEGAFRFDDLGAGEYELRATAEGYVPMAVPGVRLASEADAATTATTDLGTLVLEAGTVLEGVVLDPGGMPVEGAEIFTSREAQELFSRRRQATATSGPDGRFTLAGLASGTSVRLRVTSPGHATKVLSLEVSEGQAPVEIVLQPAARLAGRVLDQDRRPVENAWIVARPRRMDLGGVRRGTGRSAEDGSFELTEVEPGPLQFQVVAEGFQGFEMSGLELAPGEVKDDLEIVLERGATLRGTVREADGRPVANAQILLRRESGHSSSSTSAGVSDAEGRFELTGVGLGPVKALAQLGHRSTSKAVEIRPGTQSVDLVFEPGFEVAGRVSGPLGTPLAGARLQLMPADEQARTMTFNGWGGEHHESAADGTFTIRGVVPGTYQLVASKEGFASARTSFEVESDVRGLALELDRGTRLTGRILGLELDELATVKINAFDETSGGHPGRVDYEGRYVVEGLAPGQVFVSAAVGSGGRRISEQATIVEGEEEVTLDLEFPAGHTLSGTVTRAGVPLAGSRVFMNALPGPDGQVRITGSQGITDSAGRFRLENVPAGTYMLMVQGGDYSFTHHRERLEIHGDRDIQVEVPAVRLAGVVRDAVSGEPLAEAQLEARRVDGDAASDPFGGMMGGRFGGGASDSRGHFAIDVDHGVWRLTATRSGYATAEQVVDVTGGPGREDLELRLTPTESLTFEVFRAAGTVPQQVRVWVGTADGRRVAGGTHPVIDGRVRLTTVPPGAWHLAVVEPWSAIAVSTVQAPGDAGRVVLEPAGTLALTVPELVGDSTFSQLFLERSDGYRLPSFFTDTGDASWPMMDGQAHVRPVPSGTWNYTVRHGDGRSWSGTVTVTAGPSSVEVR